MHNIEAQRAEICCLHKDVEGVLVACALILKARGLASEACIDTQDKITSKYACNNNFITACNCRQSAKL